MAVGIEDTLRVQDRALLALTWRQAWLRWATGNLTRAQWETYSETYRQRWGGETEDAAAETRSRSADPKGRHLIQLGCVEPSHANAGHEERMAAHARRVECYYRWAARAKRIPDETRIEAVRFLEQEAS